MNAAGGSLHPLPKDSRDAQSFFCAWLLLRVLRPGTQQETVPHLRKPHLQRRTAQKHWEEDFKEKLRRKNEDDVQRLRRVAAICLQVAWHRSRVAVKAREWLPPSFSRLSAVGAAGRGDLQGRNVGRHILSRSCRPLACAPFCKMLAKWL